MQIFVKTLINKTLTIDIETSNTVQILKIKIGDKIEVPPDQIVLIYGGKQLQNGKILSDYKMTPECTIHLVLRFEGGN